MKTNLVLKVVLGDDRRQIAINIKSSIIVHRVSYEVNSSNKNILVGT